MTLLWRIEAVLVVVLLALAPTARAQLALTHVTVIDVGDGTRRGDQTVVIPGNRIAAVGRTDDVVIPDGARLVERTVSRAPVSRPPTR